MFFFAFSLLYIDPEMEAGGRFGERFKMSAQSPFWSSREFFMITWPMQTLSSVPVFLDWSKIVMKQIWKNSYETNPKYYCFSTTASSAGLQYTVGRDENSTNLSSKKEQTGLFILHSSFSYFCISICICLVYIPHFHIFIF